MAVKTVSALSSSRERNGFFKRFLGGILVGSFVVIWLTSVLSPVALVISYRRGYYMSSCIIISVTLISYSPWKKGAFCRWLQRIYSQYHPCHYQSVDIEFEGTSLPSPSDPQTFYAIHPHGAFCIGWACIFCLPLMDHVRFCFAPSLYASPFFRLFSRCVGTPGSASRSAMIQYLKNKEHIALPPGGFEEATLTSTNHDRVFIQKRTGFVKLCLQYGVSIRPVYVFGENKLYDNIQGMWNIRLKLNRYGIPTILVWGCSFLPLLPKCHAPLKIIVGPPIALPKIENPTKEDVALWHGKYVAALKKLFENHKESVYGDEQAKVAKLEVW